MRYLEKKYAYYWDTYTFPIKTGDTKNVNSDKIWVCWWQGIENAPEIVRKCIDSIKSNAGGREVVVITDRNVNDYVKFPDHIVRKVREGIISRTIYSDLLRLNLLATYGGVWLDSTFFASGDISQYLTLPLWSIKRNNYLHASVAGGRFANYSLGCGLQNRWIFKAVFDFLCHYWEVNNRLVD